MSLRFPGKNDVLFKDGEEFTDDHSFLALTILIAEGNPQGNDVKALCGG